MQIIVTLRYIMRVGGFPTFQKFLGKISLKFEYVLFTLVRKMIQIKNNNPISKKYVIIGTYFYYCLKSNNSSKIGLNLFSIYVTSLRHFMKKSQPVATLPCNPERLVREWERRRTRRRWRTRLPGSPPSCGTRPRSRPKRGRMLRARLNVGNFRNFNSMYWQS